MSLSRFRAPIWARSVSSKQLVVFDETPASREQGLVRRLPSVLRNASPPSYLLPPSQRVFFSSASVELGSRGISIRYKKIDIDLILPADEAEAIVASLTAAPDVLEERHTLFDGGIEAVEVDHRGTRKRSALAHTIAGGESVADAIKTARARVTPALRAII